MARSPEAPLRTKLSCVLVGVLRHGGLSPLDNKANNKVPASKSFILQIIDVCALDRVVLVDVVCNRLMAIMAFCF